MLTAKTSALKDLPWWLLHFVIMLAVETLYVVARTMFTTEKPLEPRPCYGIFNVGHLFQRLSIDLAGYEKFA